MAKLSGSPPTRQILTREPAARPGAQLRLAAAALAVLGVLLALAWIDGGEEPIHAIAEPVALPEQAA